MIGPAVRGVVVVVGTPGNGGDVPGNGGGVGPAGPKINVPTWLVVPEGLFPVGLLPDGFKGLKVGWLAGGLLIDGPAVAIDENMNGPGWLCGDAVAFVFESAKIKAAQHTFGSFPSFPHTDFFM